MKIVIKGSLPNLNDYVTACRSNRFAGAAMKNKAEKSICYAIRASHDQQQYQTPVHIECKWIEPNKRRDKDNIAFAKKFIFDALVDCNILVNGDGWAGVESFSDTFEVDKKNPRIIVTILEG